MLKCVALVCLVAGAHAAQWGEFFSCPNNKCCDKSDGYAHWPCKSWENDHMTGMCGWDNAGKHRCQCKDGFSGADCNGGAGGGKTNAHPCKATPCSGLGVECTSDGDCVDGGACFGATSGHAGHCHKKCNSANDCGDAAGASCDKRSSDNKKYCNHWCTEEEDHGVVHAVCACNDKYDHEHCDHHVECSSLGGKCVNGECHVDGNNKPECKCKNKHYSGNLCQDDDRCKNVDCGNGHCVGDDPGNGHHCACDSGYKLGSDKKCSVVDTQDQETTPPHQWQKYMLDRHNYLRSIVGHVKNSAYYNGRPSDMQSKLNNADSRNPPAQSMKKMLWSSALEKNMKKHFNTKGCKMSHSASSFRKNIGYSTNHPNAGTSATFSYAGENLAMGWGSNYKYTSDDCTGSACGQGENRIVDMWFDEIVDYKLDGKKCDGTCGHYTQVVWADSKYVGCAWCASGSYYYWGCQYGPGGNFNGAAPYKKKSGTTIVIDSSNSDWMVNADDVMMPFDDSAARAATPTAVVVAAGVCSVVVVAAVAAAVTIARRRRAAAPVEAPLMEEQ